MREGGQRPFERFQKIINFGSRGCPFGGRYGFTIGALNFDTSGGRIKDSGPHLGQFCLIIDCCLVPHENPGA